MSLRSVNNVIAGKLSSVGMSPHSNITFVAVPYLHIMTDSSLEDNLTVTTHGCDIKLSNSRLNSLLLSLQNWSSDKRSDANMDVNLWPGSYCEYSGITWHFYIWIGSSLARLIFVHLSCSHWDQILICWINWFLFIDPLSIFTINSATIIILGAIMQ